MPLPSGLEKVVHALVLGPEIAQEILEALHRLDPLGARQGDEILSRTARDSGEQVAGRLLTGSGSRVGGQTLFEHLAREFSYRLAALSRFFLQSPQHLGGEIQGEVHETLSFGHLRKPMCPCLSRASRAG